LESKTFQGQFLSRIAMDGATYHNDQNSLVYFNTLITGVNLDFASVLSEAKQFTHIKDLVESLEQEGPLSSWESLKKYYELSQVLEKREILEKLQKLDAEGRGKQSDFFQKLAFHPDSKISMQKVFQLMENPEKFLDIDDEHSGSAHERKKPANYTHFKYLDLSPEDLRDALVEGHMDKLQYFKPFEATYNLPDTDYVFSDILNLLKTGLGSYREKIQGNAKHPGKLFKQLNQLLKQNQLDYQKLIEMGDNISKDLKVEIEKLLFNSETGIKDTRKTNEFMVKVHAKSSPEGHLAGDDTSCCMPFGSGKNNVYTFNLACGQMTIQRKVEGKYRTIAQSVITPNIDINQNISSLLRSISNGEESLSKYVASDLSEKKEIIITADNIEVAPNAKGKFDRELNNIYSDFFARYAKELKKQHPNINIEKIIIGKGYSDLHLKDAQSVDNEFVPIVPPAYSDNTGDTAFELSLNNKNKKSIASRYSIIEPQVSSANNIELPRGVSQLTFEDTLRVSYVEGKVYADNESLIQYIHRIGNELIAKDVNNVLKDRPNLSTKIENDKGDMLGYMIAYEGVANQEDYNNDKSYSEEKVIYVSDLAADLKKSTTAGGKLIKGFLELFEKNYLEKNNPIQIIDEARESTSYKLIQSHINKLGAKYGYKYEMKEEGIERRGDDILHLIKLVPILDESNKDLITYSTNVDERSKDSDLATKLKAIFNK